MAALRTRLLHRHVPRHKLTALAVFIGVALTAVIGIALLRGALEDAAAAQRALAGHLHDQRLGKAALRIARAGQKPAEPAGLDHQVPSADVAHLLGHLVGHLDERALQRLLGALQLGHEIAVKAAQHAAPVDLALLDLVQLLFHRGGKAQIDDVREALKHQGVDHVAQNRRAQILSLLDDVLAAEDGGDGRGVGRRAADALFLHGADQRRLGIARGRLGEVLGALKLFEVDGLALMQVGQRAAALLLFLVLALLVYGGIAGKAQLAAVGAEEIAGTLGVDDDIVIYGVCHL